MKLALSILVLLQIGLLSIGAQASSSVDDECTLDKECTSFGQYCQKFRGCTGDKGRCACGASMKPNLKTKKCTKAVRIGDACNADKLCPANVPCTSGKCTCSGGQKALKNMMKCLATAAVLLEDACLNNGDCDKIGEAECKSNKCACKSNTVMDSTKSTCGFRDHGNQCSSNDQCDGPNVQCTSSKCACAANYIWYAGNPWREATCINNPSANVKTAVALDAACTRDGVSGPYCSSSLKCGRCPSATQFTCKKETSFDPFSSGGSTAAVGVAMTTAMLLLAACLQ